MFDSDRARQFADHEVRAAERELALGNFSGADVLCHDVLMAFPDHAGARQVRANLCARLDLREDGAAWRQSGPADGAQRYLLIKAWGFGFWADVSQVLGGLLLAELTGRTPVVRWGANSLFRAPDGDGFRQFWGPVTSARFEDVREAAGRGVFPGKWSPDNLDREDNDKWSGAGSRLGGINFLNRAEPVAVLDFYAGVVDLAPWLPHGHRLHGMPLEAIYADLIQRYLVPSPLVEDEVATFAGEHRLGADVVAVHLRGSDKYREAPNTEQINARTVQLMDLEPADRRFFLLTDDTRWFTFLNERYPGRLIATQCRRSEGVEGVHYVQDSDRVALGREVMIDTYLALECGRFIGNGRSSVSNMVALMKPWPAGSCQILDALIFFESAIPHHVPRDGSK